MDRIYSHISGGSLWQGDRVDVYGLIDQPDPKIDVICLMAREIQPDGFPDNFEIVRQGINDRDDLSSAEYKSILGKADKVSDTLADHIRDGRQVLSSCAAGLNRSGLVSAMTLMKLANMQPAEAVYTVRKNRGPEALFNPTFVKMLGDMIDKIGTKSTWANWA